MKFSCQQKDLASGINIVQKAVSTKTTLPILKGILLESNDGRLKLTGNDLSIGIETYIDANIDVSGGIVVSSRIFGEIIRKLPNAQVEITVDDNHNVRILCEKSEFNLVGQPAVEYPELPEVEDLHSFEMQQDLLSNMIRQTIFAISQNDSKPILTGSLIKVEENNITIVSIDGYRLAIRKARIDSTMNEQAVVPGKTLSEINRILGGYDGEETVKISFTEKHILVSVENVKIVSRILEGEFIQYEMIQPKEFKSELSVKTAELLGGIERASLMAREGKNNSIKLSIRDGSLHITSNTEMGSVDEEVVISLEGQDLEIGFNPKYLTDALKVMDCEDVIMKLTSSVSPCVMMPSDHDNYTYIVTPVRIASVS
ncbi:DNA polymerase III subunit beta [Fusibacter sp. JL216-2]|uniref:DNA polymerase III subunit beta n=1 Tax=Fusibacter sp. JL216-2 TaxID=3071453 RepID=UPI003D32EEBE